MSQDTSDPTDPPEPQGDGLMIEVDAPPPEAAAGGDEVGAARVSKLESALAEAKEKEKENWDKFVRSAADLENYRRRAKRDLDDAKAESRTRVLKEMLPVVDNLERALAHTGGSSSSGSAGGGGDLASVLDGVKLVLRQFSHALEKCEVTPVEAEGKPFDPNLHEAIGQQESDQPPGTVVSVLQKGYKLGDRLLRPALVVVARARPDAAPEAPPESGA